MTIRQVILKLTYPLLMQIRGKKKKKKGGIIKVPKKPPLQSIYSLSVMLNDGREKKLDELKGKKILFVNTASDCGFTPQYDELQELYDHYNDKLEIIGFPANDFKEQEKGTDEEIAAFCRINYGVTFPLSRKSVVRKTEDQNEVFCWLTHKELNGWNDQPPIWNFSKFLVNEQGALVHYFPPSVSPLDDEVVKAVNE